jgi:hypothetical protein
MGEAKRKRLLRAQEWQSVDIALDYLAAHPDRYLFPLGCDKGRPLIRDNLAQANNDTAQIKRWALQFPGCWWGLSAAKSKIIPIDIDTKPGKNGNRTVEALELSGYEFPDTETTISPSGGRHLIFKGEHHFRTNLWGGLLGADKDGRQIPTHIDCPNYVVIPGCGRYLADWPESAAVEAPDFVLEAIKPRRERPRREPAGEPVPLELFKLMLKATPYTGGPPGLDDRHEQEGWLKFAFACHEAAGGDVADYLSAFIEWCHDDPEAEEAWTAESIERRWESFTADPPEGAAAITRGSWFQLLKGLGRGDLIGEAMAGDGSEFNETADEDARLTEESEEREAAQEIGDPPSVEIVAPDKDKEKIIEKINKLRSNNENKGRTKDERETFATAAKALMKQHDITEEQLKQGTAADKDRARELWKYLCKRFIYVEQFEVFVDLKRDKSGKYPIVKKSAFESAWQHVAVYNGFAGRFGFSITKHIFMRVGTPLMPRVSTFHFAPGNKQRILRRYDAVNLWTPSDIVPKQGGDTKWWHDHLAYLFKHEDDRNKVLDWLAWIYKYQHLHPHHALLIHGRMTGTGKSVIAAVLELLLGRANCVLIDQHMLEDQFDSYKVQAKLLNIEEVRPGFGSNFSSNTVVKKMHNVIRSERIPLRMMHTNPQQIANILAILAGSNKDDALTIENTERGWLIVSVDRDVILLPMPDQYYRDIYGLNGAGGYLRDKASLAAIAWELMHRDLKRYSGEGRAPDTVAKTKMAEVTASEVHVWLAEHDDLAPMCYKFVEIDEIIEALERHAPYLLKIKGLRQRIGTALEQLWRGENLGQLWLKAGRSPAQTARRQRLWAIHKDSNTPLETTYGKRFLDKVSAQYWAERTKAGPLSGRDERAAEGFDDGE